MTAQAILHERTGMIESTARARARLGTVISQEAVASPPHLGETYVRQLDSRPGERDTGSGLIDRSVMAVSCGAERLSVAIEGGHK